MRYRLMSLIFTDESPECQIDGRVVGVVGSGHVSYKIEEGDEDKTGLGVTVVVELPDTGLVVPQMQLVPG